MTNTATFTRSDLSTLFGRAVDPLASDLVVIGISTDTRTLVAGNAFIALRGERFDGHDKIGEAISKGARLILTEDASRVPPSTPSILCASTLHALGSFAWLHRRRFTIPVVAIAGAAGKTSTKDVVAHVLSSTMTVLKTEANYNNQVGTPLTLLQLTEEHQAAVIEIGTNEPGEIEILSAMVQPTHGLITNIGKEHLEKLIDLDGVEKEETALFDFLRDHHGVALVNVDDERLASYVPTFTRAITFGVESGADIHPTVSFDDEVRPSLHIVHGSYTLRAQLRTHGLASAYNATCALAVAWALHVPAANVQHALATYQPPESHGYGRMRVQRSGDLTILNDCYNANPASMVMALKTLQRFPAAKRIAVLGDMRELGDSSEDEHMHILNDAHVYADVVIIMGEEFRRAAERMDLPHVIHASGMRACYDHIREVATADSVVLVKGSRGMAMEQVIDLLSEGSGE
ncbi:MAG: UDP-N-acetylmuramoyl-tripeptide--D-alanyl-D-alanine ligase [Bacteroidota bacterium]